MENKEKLREQLKKKKTRRVKKEPSMSGENDLLNMMEHIQGILKSNPSLVEQVNTCVQKVMSDKTLMESITGKLTEQNVVNQTFDTNTLSDDEDA